MVSKESTTPCKAIQGKRWRLHDVSKDKPHYLPGGSLYKGETHKVGATLMTGAKHSASSKVLTHTPKKAAK